MDDNFAPGEAVDGLMAAREAGKWNETAMLVIDMQNDFILPGGPMHVAGGQAIVPEVIHAVSVARHRGISVIWVCRRRNHSFLIFLHFSLPFTMFVSFSCLFLKNSSSESMGMQMDHIKFLFSLVGNGLMVFEFK
ncbi:uncharacterized protein LOC110034414 [Phalaenopsis equestris]|uniref:uncharacterized protein LOC110034414 n=1 Tax=Phalaenopsis equestris TaxID=78828 RepID=UPI0009E5587E|nr:uncharacterized protein LOC110034414 [Phalaenopsis equestris]